MSDDIKSINKPSDSHQNTEEQDHFSDTIQNNKKRKPLKLRLSYPWRSPVYATILAIYFIGNTYYPSQDLITLNLDLPLWVIPAALTAFTLILIGTDYQRFIQSKRRNQTNITRLENELAFAWQSRKKLQQKTHLYSDHADKLKRFISDRLIEQIEYDDKFLHFKSIAAEIRHNGVISYDIVRSALENSTAPDLSQVKLEGSLADTHRFGLPNNPNSGAQQALQAMKYLWDLLDLSTADNIALYIGNYLIECEEQFYQYQLAHQAPASNSNIKQKVSSPLPQMLCSANFAAAKAFGPLIKEQALNQLIEQLNSNNTNLISNSQFRIWLAPTEPLLGNENHLILVLENLIKNAQFFTEKRQTKQNSDRIAFKIFEHQGCVVISVYNRGPHIKPADKQQIFQLGYSTRKAVEHHGKGLGLFFVNEIVKGYQGRIDIENIENTPCTYTIRIALANGDIQTKVLECKVLDQSPLLHELESTQYDSNKLWHFSSLINSVEVTSTHSENTYSLTQFDQDTSFALDPEHPLTPKWSLKVNQTKKSAELEFSALDVTGAHFRVLLPTAVARQNNESLLDDELEPEAQLNLPALALHHW